MIEPREILSLIPHGLYVIGVRAPSESYLYTASWLTQMSFEPFSILDT